MLINKFKLVLSKIRLAQLNKKKILQLKISSVNFVFLDLLWKHGLIFGYNKTQFCYIIFLRYSLSANGSLNSIVFFNFKLTNKEFNSLASLNPHNNYLVLTSKGISIGSTLPISKGILIAKL